MTQVSRPLIALLAGVVLFFALWMVALKPSSSSSGGAPSGHGGLGQYQSAINAARNSVKQQDAQGATAGNIPGTATTSTPAARTPAAGTASPSPVATKPATTAHTTPSTAARITSHVAARSRPAAHIPGASHRYNVVVTALREHKALAILFYNPAGADDQAVRRELASIPTYRGRVVKLTVPVSELSRYTALTTQVMISTTPTLVLIGHDHQASLITGYASGFEIATRVATVIGR